MKIEPRAFLDPIGDLGPFADVDSPVAPISPHPADPEELRVGSDETVEGEAIVSPRESGAAPQVEGDVIGAAVAPEDAGADYFDQRLLLRFAEPLPGETDFDLVPSDAQEARLRRLSLRHG